MKCYPVCSTIDKYLCALDSNPFAVLHCAGTCRVRIKLHSPFNGTDDSGWARCYAHVGLVDSPSISALWQEAGGYNTTCGPQDLASFPDLGQVRGSWVASVY